MENVDKLMEFVLWMLIVILVVFAAVLVIYLFVLVISGFSEKRADNMLRGLFAKAGRAVKWMAGIPFRMKCAGVGQGTVLVRRPVSSFDPDIVFAAVVEAGRDINGRPEVRVVPCDESGSFATGADGKPASGMRVRYVDEMLGDGWAVYKKQTKR